MVVDDDLDVSGLFFETGLVTSETLFVFIIDVLTNFQSPTTDCRGQ